MNTYTHKELVELMRKQITTSPKKAIAALLRIYENQRVDEKSYRSVYYKNGIGFKPQDVKVLSSMAEQAIHNKKMGKENLLTEKQVNWLLKLIAKYAGQLVEGSIAEGKILKLKKGEYIVNKQVTTMGMLNIVNTIKQFIHRNDLKFIYKKFDEYNERYFNGELPALKMVINNDLGQIWGQFNYFTQLDKEIISPVQIQLNMKELKNVYVFRNVLIHEMVHYWDCLKNPPSVVEWANANAIKEKWGDFVVQHADNELIRLGYWSAINNVIGLYTDDDHSPEFKEKCHELNEKFPELWLSEQVFGKRL